MRKHGGTPSQRDKCVTLAAISPPGAAWGRSAGGHQSGVAVCKLPPLFKRGTSSCLLQQQHQREPWGASPRPSAPTYPPTCLRTCVLLCFRGCAGGVLLCCRVLLCPSPCRGVLRCLVWDLCVCRCGVYVLCGVVRLGLWCRCLWCGLLCAFLCGAGLPFSWFCVMPRVPLRLARCCAAFVSCARRRA